MDIILDDEFVTSRDNGSHRFLVKWHSHPDFDATWIKEDDLYHLDPSLLDFYLSSHSSESISFQLGGNDEAWSRPYLGLDEIRNQSLIIIFIIINYLFIRTF